MSARSREVIGPVSKRGEYYILKMLIQRCQNPNNPSFRQYGGKGVRVTERWQGPEGFANFITDMGFQPEKGYGLERLDEALDFQPGNVRWAPTRPLRLVEFQGKRQSLAEWARELKIDPQLISQRIYDGWTEVDAVSRPVQKRRSNRLAAIESSSS